VPPPPLIPHRTLAADTVQRSQKGWVLRGSPGQSPPLPFTALGPLSRRRSTRQGAPAAEPAFDHPVAGQPTSSDDFHIEVEHGTGWLVIAVVLLDRAFAPVSPLSARMQSESNGYPRPGSSLTAESSATAHSTATHHHKTPMRRLMNGLKRLNSYSNDRSDSSSSEDDEDYDGPADGQGGSEEFVERHRVQEIRFNYESWSLCSPSFQTSDQKSQACEPERSSS
jgi:hypothetical protein